jgi:predicted Zn-dependent protease
LPQYHYAIVFGYDLNSEEVIMHSGPDAFKHWDLRKFERSWMLGDYWGMVVLPPEELSAVAGEVAHLKAASAIEVYGKIPEAGMAYQQILKKWPASVGAEIGLANTSFAEKNYPEAIRYLQNATEKNPDLAIAWYNLAVAQAAIGATSDSQKNFALANKLATPEQKKIFARNLN